MQVQNFDSPSTPIMYFSVEEHPPRQPCRNLYFSCSPANAPLSSFETTLRTNCPNYWELTQAPKKTGSKELDRSQLRPKKLNYSTNPSPSSSSEIGSNMISPFGSALLSAWQTSQSVRVFHENSNHENSTPVRAAKKEQARYTNDTTSTISRGTRSQVLSNNKENDSSAVELIRKSSIAKHNVTHVDSSIENNESSGPNDKHSWQSVIEWLQPHRDIGLWIECCKESCKKWRYVEQYHDPCEVPKVWYCSMNPNRAQASCIVAETPITKAIADDLIENVYNAGSIVWAYISGCPWWPALVCDSPYTLSYYRLPRKSNKPHSYFVVFFDKNKFEYSWIGKKNLKKFSSISDSELEKKITKRHKSYTNRLKEAHDLATEAMSLTILARLKKFDFLAWHNRIQEANRQESCSLEQNSTKNTKSSSIEDDWNDVVPSSQSPYVPTYKRYVPPEVPQSASSRGNTWLSVEFAN